jgi:hypothetical protein
VAIELSSSGRVASVLLGDIDIRGVELAQRKRRSVLAIVETRLPKRLAVSAYGLNGLLPTGQLQGVHRNTPAETVAALLRARLGQELRVSVLHLDGDTGHVFVCERAPAGRQLLLPIWGDGLGSLLR